MKKAIRFFHRLTDITYVKLPEEGYFDCRRSITDFLKEIGNYRINGQADQFDMAKVTLRGITYTVEKRLGGAWAVVERDDKLNGGISW